jgi:phosphatidylglycerophosphatase A
LFRFFDIVKPPPLRLLECLPHGWGVMLDDLGAAVYTTVAAIAIFAIFGL